MKRHYLALDLGAESGRAILSHFGDGKIELNELHRFSNTPVQLPTGLYWDTLRLFDEICEGIRAGAKAADELDGIAIDTWGVDFALLGEDGDLLHGPRHYRDGRTRGVPDEIFEIVFREPKCSVKPASSSWRSIPCTSFTLCSGTLPELVKIASKLLFMPDLFNYFLTGAYAAERTVASTSQFYDPVRKGFATDMLRKLGIPAGFFAELIDPGAELGPVLPYVADRCGLDHETLVYTTGSHDTASAVAAVPAAANQNWCYISSGTWSLMGVELDAPVINAESLAANFTNEVGVAGTIRFLKNIPGLWVLQECRRAWAKAGDEYSYSELMERSAASPATKTIVDLEQFVTPGDHPRRICEFCARSGQEVPGDPGAITRVIMQSLAARYKQVLELLESITGRRIDVIHIVGGGSRNRILNQLAADYTGRRVIAGPAEATAAGNALVQAMGSGAVESLDEIRDVVRRSFELEEFVPQASS